MSVLEQGSVMSANPPQVASDLAVADLRAALAAGWQDFAAMPRFGLFFGGVYVITGLAIGWTTITGGNLTWLIPAIAGFPLIAPFVAVGLYEASRRREGQEPLTWRAVLGALKGHGDDQILSMGVIVFVAFSFWMIIVHAIFAIFRAGSRMGGETLAALTTPPGIAMLAVGSAVGAGAGLCLLRDDGDQPAAAGRTQDRFPQCDHRQPQGGAAQFHGDARLVGGDRSAAVCGNDPGLPRPRGGAAGARARDLASLPTGGGLTLLRLAASRAPA